MAVAGRLRYHLYIRSVQHSVLKYRKLAPGFARTAAVFRRRNGLRVSMDLGEVRPQSQFRGVLEEETHCHIAGPDIGQRRAGIHEIHSPLLYLGVHASSTPPGIREIRSPVLQVMQVRTQLYSTSGSSPTNALQVPMSIQEQ